MTTAVDTSVLLDVLVNDRRFAEGSSRALRDSRESGRLIVCETVLAELRPIFPDNAQLLLFADELGLEFLPSTKDGAVLAGATYARYLANKGTAKRVLPDFLVGAHALSYDARLLARDRGYYRRYFETLIVIEPSCVGAGNEGSQR